MIFYRHGQFSNAIFYIAPSGHRITWKRTGTASPHPAARPAELFEEQI
jgi:hypothetical protein